MTTAQKLAIRLSEIRSKLNELSGLEDLTAEQRAEIDSLSAEYQAKEAQHRAALIGVPSPLRTTGPAWEPWEDDLIATGARAPIPGLPHRSANAIQIRRARLGIKGPKHPYREWTAAEDAAVREAMARPARERDWPALAVKLGRSYGATRTRGWTLRRRAKCLGTYAPVCVNQSHFLTHEVITDFS